ncbi:MAG: aspartate aminotransferase family protein [Phycisphaerae bacterium]
MTETYQPDPTQETIARFERYVIGNYPRLPKVAVRGEGPYLWDADGNRYLDLFSGWAVTGVGHCHPRLVQAIAEQAGRLLYMPNTWYTEPQGRLAEWIATTGFGGKTFFCNSGAEANEAALKLARLATARGKYKIITFENSFHGRTFAAITATAQPKYQQGFQPLVPGFMYAPLNDLEAVDRLADEETCAVLLEVVQGEGGVNLVDPDFLRALRDLCDQRGMLLIVDEVQTGVGRCGTWWGYQAVTRAERGVRSAELNDSEGGTGNAEPRNAERGTGNAEPADAQGAGDDARLAATRSGARESAGDTDSADDPPPDQSEIRNPQSEIVPDIMTMAKQLGGGVAIGAMCARPEVAEHLKPGTHASTFGGNPLAAAAGCAVFEIVRDEDLLANTQHMGQYLRRRLLELKQEMPVIAEVRGVGLMVGVDLAQNGTDLVAACLAKGLHVNCTHETVLRIMPPLTITREQLDEGLDLLAGAMRAWQPTGA